jgi:rRNA-processing protein FCF1
MRHNRQKASRKHLSFLSLNFALPAPHVVVLDGPYLAEGVLHGVPVVERIVGTMGVGASSVRLCVLRSTVDELKLLPTEKFGKVLQYALDECQVVEDETVEPDSTNADLSEAAKKIVGYVGEQAYAFVCTTDKTLSNHLRTLPNVSQLRIHRTVTLLDPVSDAVKRAAVSSERAKLKVIPDEIRSVLDEEKEKNRLRRVAAKAEEKRAAGRTKKKAKGPNPLSAKKNKSKSKTK